HPNQCRCVCVIIWILDTKFCEIGTSGGRKVGRGFLSTGFISGSGFVKNAAELTVAVFFLLRFYFRGNTQTHRNKIRVCVQDMLVSNVPTEVKGRSIWTLRSMTACKNKRIPVPSLVNQFRADS